jgi:hypothetical protein
MHEIPKLILETLQAESMLQQSLAKQLNSDSENKELLMQFDKQAKYIEMLEQIYRIYNEFMRNNHI